MADLLLITTGGTIDKVYFDALSTYQVGESIAASIFEQALARLDVRHVEAFRKDSLEIDDADRAAIRAIVDAAPEERIVITHGTDTMVQTARALGPQPGKRIALTGALSPARFAQSDAMFNLGMAVATAQIAPQGVWIVMNGTVFSPDDVRKDREGNAFVRL